MARTYKTGIDYFPLNVNFFLDDKIQLIEAEFGIKGGYIVLRLLCKIYGEGYYYKWGSDECLLFSKGMGIEGVSKGLVDEVVKGLVKRGIFNESVFNKFGVLTSQGIQKRYFEATKRYKSVEVIKEYLLVDLPETNNVHIISINAGINPINAGINPQKKRKERKEEENKEDIYRGEKVFSPPTSKKPIETRALLFKSEIWRVAKGTEYEDVEKLRAFWEYWSEHGQDDKKMRFEKEKSFGIKRRLGTWFRNEQKFNAQITSGGNKKFRNSDVEVYDKNL